MQRPQTSSNAGQFLSPSSARLRCFVSPQDGQNRKRERRRGADCEGGGREEQKGREAAREGGQAGRRSNGSLRKHEHFGKIHRLSASPTLAETLAPRTDPNGQRIPQKLEKSPGQTTAPRAVGPRRDFQQGEAIQGRAANSQYYESIKMGISQQRSREIEKWQRQHDLKGKGVKKIEEVTFSLDSTEPETEEKQRKNDYQLPQRTGRIGQQEGGFGSGQLLPAFRKKIIEREIAEKEKLYRNYIRSSSREPNPHEKTRLRSRMKDVLDDLYELTKLIRN